MDLDAARAYDNEGRLKAVQYPSYWNPNTLSTAAGPNLGWAFDTMGRLNTMTDLTAHSSIISGATYGPSGELLSISGGSLFNESRTYNSFLQLTHLTSNAVNMAYGYPSTNTNGKIASQTDYATGETVTYTYDSLNRLLTAGATSGSSDTNSRLKKMNISTLTT